MLGELERTDIVRFTNGLACLERSREISGGKRYVISCRVRRFLDDIRAFGLRRPARPLAGLPDDFRLRYSDIPKVPEDVSRAAIFPFLCSGPSMRIRQNLRHVQDSTCAGSSRC